MLRRTVCNVTKNYLTKKNRVCPKFSLLEINLLFSAEDQTQGLIFNSSNMKTHILGRATVWGSWPSGFCLFNNLGVLLSRGKRGSAVAEPPGRHLALPGLRSQFLSFLSAALLFPPLFNLLFKGLK
jgi:hypothetical protein